MVEKTKEKSTEKVHFIVRELFIAKRIKRVVQAPDRQKVRNKMDDLISRQAAINVADMADYRELTVEDVKKVTDEVVKGLKQLPSAQQWIPCSERLPEAPTFCLVTTDGSYNDVIDIAMYMSDGWHKASKVLAWMPLPEPWKEVKDEYIN